MPRQSEIDDTLDDVARNFREHVGQGKPLGMAEVGDAMGVDGRTVSNYARGTTTGNLELAALLGLAVTFRDRFPGLTDGAVGVIARAFGGRFVRDDDRAPVSDDANGNGRPDPEDVSIHGAMAIGHLADDLASTPRFRPPGDDGPDRVAAAMQCIDAMRRVKRVLARPAARRVA